MQNHVIKALVDYDISTDGGKIILNFANADGERLALEFDPFVLEKIFFEIGLATTKARQLSGLAEQGIVPFFSPDQSRADVVQRGQTVLVSFQAHDGLELHFGLKPDHALALAAQMRDAAARGMLAKPETPN